MLKNKLKYLIPLIPALITFGPYFIYDYIREQNNRPLIEIRESQARNQEFPARFVSRDLTDEEMGEPPGKYQHDFNIGRTKLAQFASPKEKPQVEWKIEHDFEQRLDRKVRWLSHENLIVDSEGSTWSNYGEGSHMFFLKKINPNGTIAWDINPSPFISYIEPVVVLNGGVVCLLTKYEPENEYGYGPAIQYFEYFDRDGQTIWRTENFRIELFSTPYQYNNSEESRTQRIFGDKFIYDFSGKDSTTYKVISLKDGQILDDRDYFAWRGTGPLILDDGKYIGGTYPEIANRDYLTCFNIDGTISWKSEVDLSYSFQSPILSPDGILYCLGNGTDLNALDSNSGELLWSYILHGYGPPFGISANNNVITFEYIRKNHSTLYISEFDALGKKIKSTNWEKIKPSSPGRNAPYVIYEDNSILMGFNKGITLFDLDGNTYWTLTQEELGIPPGLSCRSMLIYPAPEDRLVVQGGNWDSYIISFGPEK